MKKQIVIFSAILLSTFAFAQKNELKEATKALKNGNSADAKVVLASLEGTIDSADEKYQTQYYFLKGQVYQDMAAKGLNTQTSYETSVEAFKKLISLEESGKKKYTDEAKVALDKMAAELVDAAVVANENKNYDVAAKKLHMAYLIDKKNTDYLYFAATTAVMSEDYDNALVYYKELKDMGYTGITTKYYATDVETNEEGEVSKTEYELYKKSKNYTNLREKETESRLPEIVKNIALIYTQQGKVEEAIAAVKDAREANPKDIDLLLTEANLYIKNGQKDKFKEVMEEAVVKDPTNPVLYFNLGVINAEQGDLKVAKSYYEKALEVDPNYKDSYLNLSALILDQEGSIVEEMNSLGTSRADNARYDELKAKREDLYRSAIPYLEKLLAIDENDLNALKTLMNIYGTLGENDKFKEVKEKITALEQ
ncbi:tetratricopeptide repeat protein [Ascidiimonas sp. W6]|uniref:tetratricopeptide repeat protein n=1 Tax=Ascidiimonas meishanensis TaxID=3128903 RepID=UPI0030EF65AD